MIKLQWKRRDFIYRLAAATVAGPRPFMALLRGEPRTTHPADLAVPSPQQRAWQDLSLGMFVHFAPNTWQDVESDDLSTPLSQIDPEGLDTDQWAATAVAMGARYIVFVAKHQGGFCMWQTQTTDYGIRNTPWKNGKGDVLAEVVASCRKHGIRLGVYVCPRDDHFGAGTGGICKTPALQKQYDAMYRQQLTEVLSGYGEMVEIWFDGSSVTPVGDLLKRYQPNAMVFQGPQATIRWVGNEEGFAPYPCWNGVDLQQARKGTSTALDGEPNGKAWLPNEVDVSIRRPDWFWHTNNENKVLTLDQLLSVYYRSVGRGAQLLLNIPANRQGLLAKRDCAVAAEFGKEIQRRFDTPLAATKGTGRSIVLSFDKPTCVDTVVLQEDISLGERVRAYRLEGNVDGSWLVLARGSAVGQRRIQPVMSHVCKSIRLLITEAVAEPHIRALAAFNIQSPPPVDWDAPSSIWAPNLVGEWNNGRFELDLTKQIVAATQYVLRFHPQQGTVSGFQEFSLEIGGVSSPALIERSHHRRDELLLDITGLDRTVRVRGRVLGAESGSILLERK